MKVLVACEESQVVCNAFRARGHEAYSCDIVPTRGKHPEWHIQDDVRNLLFATGNFVSHPYPLGAPTPGNQRFWDMMVAHPDCRYLTNSGVRWLYNPDGSCNFKRWWDMANSASFFNVLFDGITCKIPKVCIENPIPHKHASLPKYTQIIQPWMFGHGETKSTCLWLKNLPKLVPTDIVDGRQARVHRMAPSEHRARDRAVTYQGIAVAMADQWGSLADNTPLGKSKTGTKE
jgi:hypothetical protein